MKLVEPQQPPEIGKFIIEGTTEARSSAALELDVAGEPAAASRAWSSQSNSESWGVSRDNVGQARTTAPCHATPNSAAQASTLAMKNLDICITRPFP